MLFAKSSTYLHKLKHLYQGLMQFVAPSSCAVCFELLQQTARMGVCASCYGKLPEWDVNTVAEPPLPRYVDRFDAPFLYDEAVKVLITAMKFSDKPEYAHALAQVSQDRFKNCLHEDVLVLPVPMHRKRLIKRMYNQSVELVKALRRYATFDDSLTGLRRVRPTKPQVGQSAKARQQNLKDAFEVLIDVQDRSILLVDDVWTTGSTADACAKCLKKAGAKEVAVFTIAYVEKPTVN